MKLRMTASIQLEYEVDENDPASYGLQEGASPEEFAKAEAARLQENPADLGEHLAVHDWTFHAVTVSTVF